MTDEINTSDGTTGKGWYMHDSAEQCNLLKLKLKALVRGTKDAPLMAVLHSTRARALNATVVRFLSALTSMRASIRSCRSAMALTARRLSHQCSQHCARAVCRSRAVF